MMTRLLKNYGAATNLFFFSPTPNPALIANPPRSARRKSTFLIMWSRTPACWRSGAASWCLRMDRNLVLISLGRAPPQRARTGRAGGPCDRPWQRRMRRTNFALFKDEDFAAPVNGVVSKAGEPHSESYEIAQRHQPQATRYSAVMHNSDPNFE